MLSFGSLFTWEVPPEQLYGGTDIVDAAISVFHHEPWCEGSRLSHVFPVLPEQSWHGVSRPLRESTMAGQNDGDDSPRGWEVVVLCDPRLFIIRCSIKQAWGQLLPCSRPAFSSPLRAYFHSQHLLFFVFAFFHLHLFPPVHHLFVFVPLSCFPSPYLFLPAPSTSPFWIQYPLIMREWFSWAWPVAQIRVRQYFPLTVRACYVWIRQLQMLPRQECRCVLLCVHYEIKKKEKRRKSASLRADE